jgi:hypothetical protein
MTKVTVAEHEDSVSILYDDKWQLTLWCRESHVGFVHDTMFKWAVNLSKGKIAPSPVWHLILGGIVTEYSDEPGESITKDDGKEEKE